MALFLWDVNTNRQVADLSQLAQLAAEATTLASKSSAPHNNSAGHYFRFPR